MKNIKSYEKVEVSRHSPADADGGEPKASDRDASTSPPAVEGCQFADGDDLPRDVGF